MAGFQLTCEQREHRLPALPEVHCGREQEHLKCGIDRIDAMIEKLSQRPALARSARLAAIDRVKCLV